MAKYPWYDHLHSNNKGVLSLRNFCRKGDDIYHSTLINVTTTSVNMSSFFEEIFSKINRGQGKSFACWLLSASQCHLKTAHIAWKDAKTAIQPIRRIYSSPEEDRKYLNTSIKFSKLLNSYLKNKVRNWGTKELHIMVIMSSLRGGRAINCKSEVGPAKYFFLNGQQCVSRLSPDNMDLFHLGDGGGGLNRAFHIDLSNPVS